MEKEIITFIDKASKEDLKEFLVALKGKKCVKLIDFVSSSVSNT